jgi:hypothetical protein
MKLSVQVNEIREQNLFVLHPMGLQNGLINKPLLPPLKCCLASIITFVVDWHYLILCIPSQFQVTRSLSDLPVLFALMRVVQSLLRNPHIHIEPYVSGWA